MKKSKKQKINNLENMQEINKVIIIQFNIEYEENMQIIIATYKEL